MIINSNLNAANTHENLDSYEQRMIVEGLNENKKISRAVNEPKVIENYNGIKSEIKTKEKTLVEKVTSETQIVKQGPRELQIINKEILKDDISNKAFIFMIKALNLMQTGIAPTVLEVMTLKAIRAI